MYSFPELRWIYGYLVSGALVAFAFREGRIFAHYKLARGNEDKFHAHFVDASFRGLRVRAKIEKPHGQKSGRQQFFCHVFFLEFFLAAAMPGINVGFFQFENNRTQAVVAADYGHAGSFYPVAKIP